MKLRLEYQNYDTNVQQYNWFHKIQDHLRMIVAPDQTIILCLQIFLGHRTLSSIDQKVLMDCTGLWSQMVLDHISSY